MYILAVDPVSHDNDQIRYIRELVASIQDWIYHFFLQLVIFHPFSTNIPLLSIPIVASKVAACYPLPRPLSNIIDSFLARSPLEIFFSSLPLPLGQPTLFMQYFLAPPPSQSFLSIPFRLCPYPLPPFLPLHLIQSKIQLLIYSSHDLTYHIKSEHITSYFTILFELTDIVTEYFPEDEHKVYEIILLLAHLGNSFYYDLNFIRLSQTKTSNMVLSVLLTLTHVDYVHICTL